MAMPPVANPPAIIRPAAKQAPRQTARFSPTSRAKAGVTFSSRAIPRVAPAASAPVTSAATKTATSAAPNVAQGMSKSYLSQQIASKMSQASSKGIVPAAAKAVSGPAVRAGLGRVGAAIGGPTGLAVGAAAPVLGAAMKQSYQKGHSSMIPHKETPGVKASDSFERMKQMKAATPTPAKAEPTSFKQAFAQARKEAGTMGAKSTGQFEYKGSKYQTNIQGKGTAKAPEEKFVPMSQQKVTSVGKSAPAASTSTSTTPGSMNVAKQPAPPASATAGMSSAAEKSGVSQTPAPSMKNDFAAGKDVSSTPVPTTSTAPASTPKEPEVKASVSTAPEPAPAKAPEPSYSADSPAGKAWANRGKFGGTQQEEKKMVAESYVSVGDNKYRIV